MMTRKDYELIAQTLKAQQGAYMIIAWALADAFAKDNKRFNKDKFIKACERDHGYAK